jgi:hypothetical protein
MFVVCLATCIFKLGKCCCYPSSVGKPRSVQPTRWVFFILSQYIELWWVMLVPGIEVSEVCTSFVILKKGALKLSASTHSVPVLTQCQYSLSTSTHWVPVLTQYQYSLSASTHSASEHIATCFLLFSFYFKYIFFYLILFCLYVATTGSSYYWQ